MTKKNYILILFVFVLSPFASFAQNSDFDTLFILRDYDPKIKNLSNSGSNVLWNITNEFEAPPYMRPYRRVSTQSSVGKQVSIYDEKGFESQYYIDNNGIIRLRSTQRLVLNENDEIRGEIMFSRALPEYHTDPQIGLSSNYRGSATAKINYPQLPVELKKKAGIFGIDVASLEADIEITRKVSRDNTGLLQYSIFENLVYQEVIEETKTITFYSVSNEKRNQIGVPVAYHSNITRFYEEGTYYPLLEVFSEKGGKQIYAEYSFTEQMQFLDLIRNPNSTNIVTYPNPTEKSYVKFEFNNVDKGKYTISFFNILGQHIRDYSFDITSNDAVTINLIAFEQGTYLYQIKNNKGKTLQTKRLVVLKP